MYKILIIVIMNIGEITSRKSDMISDSVVCTFYYCNIGHWGKWPGLKNRVAIKTKADTEEGQVD